MKANRFRFRAWCGDYNKMVECNSEGMDNSVLMQSTGLTDSRGKEIFEGDILEWNGSNGHWKSEREVVRWVDGSWSICRLNRWPKSQTTIIGNIYQNPELLKSG